MTVLIHLALKAAAVAAAGQAPCDIYAAGGTPCVAAHSLSRALYGGYAGPLYRLQRESDRVATDIRVLGPGGRADSAAHDAFCSAPGATCSVERIYDQSPWGNHLGVEHGPGYLKGPRGAQDRPVNFSDSSRSSAMLGGQKVFAAYFAGGDQQTYGQGYSNRTARGTAVGEEPQSIYAVLSGKTFNGHCCFD